MPRLISCLLAMIFLFCVQVAAQDPDGAKVADTQRSRQLFERFDTTAKTLDLVTSESDDRFVWSQSPLFRFSSEGTVFGSVYVWHDSAARLAAVGTIGSIPIGGNDVEFVELHLLKPESIVPLDLPGGEKRWQPDVSDLSLRAIDNAPNVGKTEAARLIQMRNIARQFQADMISDGQTNHLRLLPQPIYRYADSTSDRDGGLFAFIWDKGTDPELLIRFEIEAQANGPYVWRYQPIRFTWRELDLRYRESTVWHGDELLDRNRRLQTTPYVTGLTTMVP